VNENRNESERQNDEDPTISDVADRIVENRRTIAIETRKTSDLEIDDESIETSNDDRFADDRNFASSIRRRPRPRTPNAPIANTNSESETATNDDAPSDEIDRPTNASTELDDAKGTDRIDRSGIASARLGRRSTSSISRRIVLERNRIDRSFRRFGPSRNRRIRAIPTSIRSTFDERNPIELLSTNSNRNAKESNVGRRTNASTGPPTRGRRRRRRNGNPIARRKFERTIDRRAISIDDDETRRIDARRTTERTNRRRAAIRDDDEPIGNRDRSARRRTVARRRSARERERRANANRRVARRRTSTRRRFDRRRNRLEDETPNDASINATTRVIEDATRAKSPERRERYDRDSDGSPTDERPRVATRKPSTSREPTRRRTSRSTNAIPRDGRIERRDRRTSIDAIDANYRSSRRRRARSATSRRRSDANDPFERRSIGIATNDDRRRRATTDDEEFARRSGESKRVETSSDANPNNSTRPKLATSNEPTIERSTNRRIDSIESTNASRR